MANAPQKQTAGKKLAANVQVGETVYEAGSTPPKDVAEQITNPKAWESDEDTESADAGSDES